METRDLISELSGGLKPVKPLAPPFTRFLQWLAFMAFMLVGLALWKKQVPDFVDAMGTPTRFLETIALLAVGLFAGSGAFVLSVPGQEERRSTRWWPVLALVAWLGLLAFRFTESGPFSWQGLIHAFSRGHSCAVFSLTASLLPGISLFYMLRKAAPLRSAWTGALGLIGTAALGAFVIQFLCPGAPSLHFLAWHFTPVLAVGVVGAGIGRLFLRWRPWVATKRPLHV